jgi:hypothetical protein
MCLACGCSPFSRLLALMWFARRVLIKPLGWTPVTQQKVLPPRRPTYRHHAISTSATRDAFRRVPLALALRSCAAAAPITASPSPLSGSHARPRSILWGAMAGLVDAAVDHDGPGEAGGLVSNRDRRLLWRHWAEQLRDPGMLIRADLRLAHDGSERRTMNQAAKRPAKSNRKPRTVATVPAGDGSTIFFMGLRSFMSSPPVQQRRASPPLPLPPSRRRYIRAR